MTAIPPTGRPGTGVPSGPSGVFARFDDLGEGGRSFVLTDPVEWFVATEPARVAEVLAAAEDAARRGRWVAGFVSYEAAAGLDSTLPVAARPTDHPLSGLPLVWFAAFARRQDVTCHAIDRTLNAPEPPATAAWRLDQDERHHRDAVERIRLRIAAGDFYQVNLTARLSGTVRDAFAQYARLAVAQRGRFNAFMSTGEHAVASASPELFFTRDDRLVTTRPMKGTASRGRWPGEDEQHVRALRTSAKERAENIMIVDLLRNDLGRIAETGTVAVRSLLEPERYPTVWQLTSTVTALAREGTDLVDLFRALFPSGSVTGAPKVAAMRAIVDLEDSPRGVYCGAVGYLAPHPVRPPLRFSVAIRTLTTAIGSGYAEYGAGGGITWSSDPAAEWAELLTKTVVLRRPPRAPARLLESMRFEPPGRVANMDRHLARLVASARHFGFPEDVHALRAAVWRAVTGRADTCRVRLWLDSTGAVAAEAEPLTATPDLTELAIADRTVCSEDVLLFHKHDDRRRYDEPRRSRPDVDDVLLVNERGHVTESTCANLAVLIRGRWWTPPLDSGLLPGIERARLLETGELAERVLTPDDVASADAVALVSSLRGWRPARLAVCGRMSAAACPPLDRTGPGEVG